MKSRRVPLLPLGFAQDCFLVSCVNVFFVHRKSRPRSVAGEVNVAQAAAAASGKCKGSRVQQWPVCQPTSLRPARDEPRHCADLHVRILPVCVKRCGFHCGPF